MTFFEAWREGAIYPGMDSGKRATKICLYLRISGIDTSAESGLDDQTIDRILAKTYAAAEF